MGTELAGGVVFRGFVGVTTGEPRDHVSRVVCVYLPGDDKTDASRAVRATGGFRVARVRAFLAGS